ncbi:RNA polymerase sigma factor [Croceicoccus estronivorus]|uniref:RNA polymerase sigma factor n=1 Tax=Croceicoccus estronivorus TaxID=1172626 RepID=UPI001F2B99D4|nr:sigma-70 family RNA polymerase sigma factor [Croceicoccus estronivorus]
MTGIFESHRGELLRFLTARCGDREEAEDLLQELWIKASGQPADPIANGRAYLFRMANNLVLDQRRARQRAMARDHNWLEAEGQMADVPEKRPDPALPADETIVKQQEAELVRQAIAALPPGAQKALRLHRLEGLGQAEVAQVMGISRSGVEKHLAVAMKHLRNALADCGLIAPVASKEKKAIRGGEPRKDTGT